MASENGNGSTSLDVLESLQNETPRWHYYAALRQLECLYPQRPRLGKSRRPQDDFIRLEQEPSTIFAPSTLHQVTQDEKGQLRLSVLFMGMFGVNGPLPLHLTEYVRNRRRDAHDESMIQFMNMFHHRLLSLFYRVWADKEPTVQYDRPETDRFQCYVGSLLGIGTPELRQRDRLLDNSKLHFAGHFGSTPHHSDGLLSILSSFFNAPIRIKEFVGEWLKIPDDSVCTLGVNGGSLGVTTVLGGLSWQRQYKFRILIGPLQLEEYEQLLPEQKKLALIADVIKNYVGYEMACDIRLVLEKKQIPKAVLGSYGQLGWTTWLNNQLSQNVADDLVLNIRI
jgi:type VI secretion system protein ImpH